MKKFNQLLSVILILAMFLSLGTTAFAADPETAAAEDSGYGASWDDWDDAPAEDPADVPVFEEPEEPEVPEVPEEPEDGEITVFGEEPETAAFPANEFYYVGGSGLRVTVKAPEGAFPADASMSVEEIKPEYVQQMVDASGAVDGAVLVAADISFTNAAGELQPLQPVEVSISTPDARNAQAPVVVHVNAAEELEVVGKLAELAGPGVSPLTVENAADACTYRFEAKSFSIYAVVEPETPEDTHLLSINFVNNNASPAVTNTVTVKNGDDLNAVIYDPGAGTLGARQLFLGWTEVEEYTDDSTRLTIEEVRAAAQTRLDAMTESASVTYYAAIFDYYNVSYVHEDGAVLRTDNVHIRPGAAPSYTVSENYTPVTEGSVLMGWQQFDGTQLVGEVYPNGTAITLTGDLELRPVSGKGFWLIFDGNGDRASYTAPIFVAAGEGGVVVQATAPEAPTRPGYSHNGWYPTAADAEAGTNAVSFPLTLNGRTTLYAGWTMNQTATYRVVQWMQSVHDGDNGIDSALHGEKHYEVWKDLVFVGTVGEMTDIQFSNTPTVDGDGTVYYRPRVKGTTADGESYDSVTLPSGRIYRLDTITNVEIAADGSSVVNMYYDLALYEYKFFIGHSVNSALNWNDPVFDPEENTEDLIIMRGIYNQPFTPPEVPGTWVQKSNNGNEVVLTQHYYLSVSIPGDSFPSPREQHWSYTPCSTVFDYYYQNLDLSYPEVGTPGDTQIVGGNRFTFRGAVPRYGFALSSYARYNGDRENPENYEQWADFAWNQNVLEQTVFYNGKNLAIRAQRQRYNLKYEDGGYFTGDGIPIDEIESGLLHTDQLLYEEPFEPYGPGGEHYYTPPLKPGYSFVGWFRDKSCTVPAEFSGTMYTTTTVFAKWIRNDYRVFLHTNVPSTDTTLDLGERPVSFLQSAGSTIEPVDATRNGYVLVGWYSDPAMTQAWNFEDTEINGTTVTTPYDRTQDTNLDKYGTPVTTGNEDAANGRFWVNSKLDLYAKWRMVLNGADGVHVVYDVNGGSSEAPVDNTLYLDQAEAVAQDAAVPAAGSTDVFKYWKVMKWENGDWTESGVTAVPGATFIVHADEAKVEGTGSDTTYTVKLLAFYGPVEEPSPVTTTITFNANGGAFVGEPQTNYSLRINEAITALGAADVSRNGGRGYGLKEWNTKADGTGVSFAPGSRIAADNRDLTNNGSENTLYAIWDEFFYVYHESSGSWEKVAKPNTASRETYTAEGYYYGGYGLIADAETAAPAGVSFAADGSASGSPGFVWSRSTAQKSAAAFDRSTGDLYFIKEVGSEFLPVPAVVTTKDDYGHGVLTAMYVISATDTNIYRQGGVMIGGSDNRGSFAKTFTMSQNNGGSTGFTAASLFGLSADNYLTVASAAACLTDGSYVFQPYWITYDSVHVPGGSAKNKTVTVSGGGSSVA